MLSLGRYLGFTERSRQVVCSPCQLASRISGRSHEAVLKPNAIIFVRKELRTNYVLILLAPMAQLDFADSHVYAL